MMITAAQFSQFFVIAPSVNPIEDTVFQDRKVRIRFYAHNNWNHHLVTASQAMVESRKESGSTGAAWRWHWPLWGTAPDRLLAVPTWSLSATLYLLPSLCFTTFLHRALQRGCRKANL